MGTKEEICRWKPKNNEHLLIFDDFGKKKIDYGQKIRFCEKEVGNFSTSNCAKNCAFQNFSKNKFILNRTPFLIIFLNLRKRLESTVLAGRQCKFSVKAIIFVLWGLHDIYKKHLQSKTCAKFLHEIWKVASTDNPLIRKSFGVILLNLCSLSEEIARSLLEPLIEVIEAELKKVILIFFFF